MSDGYWLGVDLGGTKILAGLFDDDLKLLARAKQPTGRRGRAGGGVRPHRRRPSRRSSARRRSTRPRSAAWASASPARSTSAPRWSGSPRTSTGGTWTSSRSCPAAWRWPVVVENDVRMGTYGEFAHGAAKGARHVFGIFVGTGVGGGLILNGELFTGFNGNAGEIGHIDHPLAAGHRPGGRRRPAST